MATVIISLKVDPSSVWLRDAISSRAYMPDSNGTFNLPHNELSYGTVLQVEGSDYSNTNSGGGSSTSSSSSSNTTISSISVPGRQSSPFQSVIPSKRCNLSSRYSLKVVKATISGKAGNKPVFNTLEQIYVDLTDKTASAITIKSAVQEEWGDEYTLVTADGLEVKDSAGTTGKNTLHSLLTSSLCITQACSFGNVAAESFMPY